MKFEILKSKNGKSWYYNLKGDNGEIMVTSEMLNSKQTCKHSIRSIMMNCGPDTTVADLTDDE